MVSRQETARALLTPGEVMQLPLTDEIVLVSGFPPIRVKKARYYQDRRLTARILPPPRIEQIDENSPLAVRVVCATNDDWSALPPPMGKTATDEDPANGGIRREPELLEHEEIAPLESNLVSTPEAFLGDEVDDEEAIKARILRSQNSLACGASRHGPG